MPSCWNIRANDRSYGPYTLDQMRSFVHEGRLAPHSFVAADGSTVYKPASEDPDLAALFRPAQRPVFFTAEGDMGRAREEPQPASINRFLVIADMKSGSIAGLEEEMRRCGQATQLMSQAWLLVSDRSLNALRNTLIQKLGRLDILFMVDATNNKAAWFNYAPEAESRIRRVWQKAQEIQTA
jgi:hypothetical protein